MTTSEAWAGISIALGAGVVIGSVLMPFKLVKGWAWENGWFVFSISAYLLAPWIVAAWTIPHLFLVYQRSTPGMLAGTALLGFGWGLAVVLVGIALDMVGLSISTVLLYGMSVAFGSLGALFLVDSQKIFSPDGTKILLWNFVLLAGVALCARGSSLREPPNFHDRPRLRRGIALSILAGALSTLFNLVLAFGRPLQQTAIALGAPPHLASNVIWSLAVSAGSLPSILWCIYLLARNRSWSRFRATASVRNSIWCVLMGIAWITGTVLYGVATLRMGDLGTVVAWPIYLCAVILTGTVWGFLFGEWKSAPRRALNWLYGGIALQIMSVVLLSSIR
jgi:L-rhamnose-H+ transport protein